MTELVSERIRRLRQARGLTQRDLGERIGATHMSVHYWERGSDMMARYVLPMARALGVTTDYLLAGRERVAEARDG